VARRPRRPADGGDSVNLGNLVNAGLFQITWFACVLGGAAGTSWWGAGALASLLAFSAAQPHLKSDLRAALGLGVVGLGVETLWIWLGVLDYGAVAVAPPWIVMLWMGVGLTLNHSLALFAQRPWLGGLLAGAGAPLSYLGGERLGGVVVPDPWMLALIASAWFVLFTVVFALTGGRLDMLRRQPYERAH